MHQDLLKLFKKIRTVKYTHLQETASYAYRRKQSTLYLYFEESNGKTDWKNNFDFPAKPYRDMCDKWYAHRGFLKVWRVIEPNIKDQILDKEVKHIIIGGYSHGAAIALLCHEYCKFNRPEILIEGYGFGCPRVVWGHLRKPVKKRFEGFTVIRNGTDIVTHVPPSVIGYHHVGKLIKIGRGKRYLPIASHFPWNYKKELRNLHE